MSIPEPWPDAGPTLSEDAVTGNGSASRMNQPWRAGVAITEVLVAVALAFGAWWAWGHGIVTVVLTVDDRTVDVVARLVGSWLALAVLFATVAGLSVLDSFRQVVLALGTGRRRKAREIG